MEVVPESDCRVPEVDEGPELLEDEAEVFVTIEEEIEEVGDALMVVAVDRTSELLDMVDETRVLLERVDETSELLELSDSDAFWLPHVTDLHPSWPIRSSGLAATQSMIHCWQTWLGKHSLARSASNH